MTTERLKNVSDWSTDICMLLDPPNEANVELYSWEDEREVQNSQKKWQNWQDKENQPSSCP